MKITNFKLVFLFLLMVTGLSLIPLVVAQPHVTAKKTVPTINYAITPQGHFGDITSTTTRKSLIKLFGVTNVKDGVLTFAEGQTEKGTIVFPNKPDKRVEILWTEKGIKVPQTIRISGNASKWHLVNGITLNDSLVKVKKYNQQAFKLYGFEWDYGGYVTNWQHGKMENFNSKHTHVMLRFSPAASYEGLSEAQINSVSGEGEFSSSNPVLRKMNPKISQIIFSFY